MSPSPSGRRALFLSALLLLVPGISAHAADPPGLRFAPVQLGFQPNAPIVAAHAPDRVLVQLTRDARESSRLPDRLRFGDVVPGVALGLTGLDRVLAEGGARSLRRAHIDLKNAEEAERLGV